jgi:hypothetical protein
MGTVACMGKKLKILTVGLAFAGLTALAAPAQAQVARIPCDPGKLGVPALIRTPNRRCASTHRAHG